MDIICVILSKMEITPPPKKKKVHWGSATLQVERKWPQVKAMENSIIISGCY